MASVTLRFVTDGDIVSAAIRGGEMGFWASHVEALTPDGKLLGAHYAGGVQARTRDYDAGQWKRQLFVVLPATDDQARAFYAFLASQVGKPYDMTAIGEMALGVVTGEAPNWAQSPSWICSALQTAALLTSGIMKSAPASVRLATPRDVLVGCAWLATIGEPQAAAA